jgi:hypothetical protein
MEFQHEIYMPKTRRKEFSLSNNEILEARKRHGIQIRGKKREYPMECA